MNAASDRVLDLFVTANIIRLGNKFTRHGELLLEREKDMTIHEWRTLVWLERLVEPTRDQMQSALALSDSDFGDVVASLEKRELISRIGTDRMSLTAAGDAMFDEIFPMMLKRQDDLVQDEDPDELALFMETLHRLENRVDTLLEQLDTRQAELTA